MDITTELNLGGTWTDISADVRTASDMTGTRGRSSWASEADPSKYVFSLNNRHGKYSPRNPLSPYYRLLSRNTPIRISVPSDTSHLEILDATGTATTGHSEQLDIAGDLDVRIEFDATLTEATANQALIGKWSSNPDEKQWLLSVYYGYLRFRFIDTTGTERSTFQHIAGYGGKVLRVTLDADNGSGGWTVRFWQADEWGGTWVSSSIPITSTGPGPRSVTAGPLAIGLNDPTGSPARTPFIGYAYRAQVRRGIKGVIVADVDFRTVPAGTTAFTDATGNEWTLSGGAQIAARNYRLHGEVSEWPAETDDADTDSIVRVTAQSLKRRLDSGRDPLKSVLARRLPGMRPRAYWPLEEGTNASQAYSPLPGVRPMTTLNMTFGQDTSLPSSAALPVVATQNGAVTSRLSGQVSGGSSTSWSVYWLYRLNTQPTGYASYMSVQTNGTIRDWRVQISNIAGANSRIVGYDSEGVAVISLAINTGTDLFNQWVLGRFWGSQSGGTVTWGIDWDDVNGVGGAVSDSFTGTLGRVTSVGSPPNGWHSFVDGLALGHISVWDATTTEAYDNPNGTGSLLQGYAGEYTADRITRLAWENNVPLRVLGKRFAGQRTGPQPVDTFLTAIREATTADGGILLDQRARNGFLYLGPSVLQNQNPTVTLDYTQPGHVIGKFQPVDDDSALENDSTVTRDGGSSGRYVKTEGSLNVNPPESDEDGVGRYAKSVTLSLYEDAQCAGLAAWRVHLGTWDEARLPTLTVDADAIAGQLPEVAALDIGDVIRLRNVPTKHSYDDLYLLVQGYTEVLNLYRWQITFNCVPYGPWVTAIAGEARADTTGSTLETAATATATVLQVVNDGARWARSDVFTDDYPMDILVDGERMTLTGAGGALEDSYDRTVADGWGTADTGQAWTVTGTATDYAVGSGYGSANQPAVNVAHLTLTPAPAADVDLVVDVATSVLASGASLYAGPLVRAASGTDFYVARLEFTTAAGITLTIRKRVANVEAQVGSSYTSGLTHVADTWYRVRVQVAGSSLKAKVWPAGHREPSAWHIEATDTALTTAANVGTRSYASTGSTAVGPQIRFRRFRLIGPQRLEVVRSVNGVVKAQPAGARVSLFQMPFTALTE
ncbi:hypothetical protein ACIO8H_16020 [Streptomyces sp. NPDC087226]|uniref:hypothetical protein n=1 Tax=Streptomyces sp. NPDC087226 TaxID=3365771 RepID=UPI00382D2C2D